MDDSINGKGNSHSPSDLSMSDSLSHKELEALIRNKQDNELAQYLSNDRNFTGILSDEGFRDLQFLLRMAQAEHLTAYNTLEDLHFRLSQHKTNTGREKTISPPAPDDKYRQLVARIEAQHDKRTEPLGQILNEVARVNLLRDNVKAMAHLIDGMEGKPTSQNVLRTSIVRTVKRRTNLLRSAEEAEKLLREIEQGQNP